MSRVFILEQMRNLDAGQAERYGQLRYLFPPECNRPSIWKASYTRELIAELEREGFDYKTDYFLAAGSNVPVTLATAAIALHYGGVRLLLWNSIQRGYVAREVSNAA
jgi:hypothetical protein